MYSIFTSSSIFAYLILSSFDILLSSLSIVYLFLNFYPISHLLWFAIPFLLLHYLPSFSSLYSYPPYFVPLTSYLFQSPFFGDPLLTSLFLSCVFFFLFLLLSPAMHLFGLNWQLQESEGYGAFENGGGGRDTTPNTFMVSTDNGKFIPKYTV